VTAEPAKDRIAYHRERAAEARAKGETMRDLQARETMMTVARMWESMAKTAERHSH
jgi:hypothetical protein